MASTVDSGRLKRNLEKTAADLRKKTALSVRIVDMKTLGDPRMSKDLAEMWMASENQSANEHIHGFHTWSARVHPVLAKSLIGYLSKEGERVVDPFAGSGTIPIEAAMMGRRSFGSDLNPLSMRLASMKAKRFSEGELNHISDGLLRAAAASEERIRARVPVFGPRELLTYYSSHVLKELTGLLECIREEDAIVRDVGEILFSSIAIKFSRKRADTSDVLVHKQIRKGLATEFFVRRCGEWIARARSFRDLVGSNYHPPAFAISDARNLTEMVDAHSIDLVLTSPPYGGIYDYENQHSIRLRWLNLQSDEFAAAELGARRFFAFDKPTVRSETAGPQREKQSNSAFRKDIVATLSASQKSLRHGGYLAWIVGDAELNGKTFPMRSFLGEIGSEIKLIPKAAVSALRAHPERPNLPGRVEHLVVFQVPDHPAGPRRR